MNKVILIRVLIAICFIITSARKSHAYEALVSYDKIWSNLLLTNDRVPYRTTRIKFEFDSAMPNYSKVMVSYDTTDNWGWTGRYISEDNGKVMVKYAASEYMLYDFNLVAKDSFIPLSNETLYVASTFNQDFAGRNRKFIVLKSDIVSDSVVWVEGIGSLSGLFENGGNLFKIGGFDILLCYQINGNVNFRAIGYDACFISGLSSIESSKIPSLSTARIFATPNPFNPTTCITLTNLPSSIYIQLKIFDIHGRLVRMMQSDVVEGIAKFKWDGTNNIGEHLSSGNYFAKISNEKILLKTKLILTK